MAKRLMNQSLKLVHQVKYLNPSCVVRKLNAIRTSGCLHTIRMKSTTKTPVLSHSVLVLQDGLDIHEIPIVIKRMDPSDFPFTSPSNSGKTRMETKDEQQFRSNLLDCRNMKEVFQLLEMPNDHVTCYAAAFALQHICQLMQVNGEDQVDMHSFVRQAVLHELFETATKDIKDLKTSTLFQLIKCSFLNKDCDERHATKLNNEFEHRVGDNALTISELCEGIALYSHPKGDEEVLGNLWIHLGNRYQDIDETNVSAVFNCLKYMDPNHKYILNIIQKRLRKCFFMLNEDDVALIAKTIAFVNYRSPDLMSSIGRWLYLNVHKADDEHLIDMLTPFLYFKFFDSHLTSAVERYTHAKAERMDKKLIAMVAEYLRVHKYSSERIVNAVMQDFAKNGEEYLDIYMIMTLRILGVLNYLPPNANSLFTKIEKELISRFDQLDAASVIDLLCSFTFIERQPINFLEKVFTEEFLTKINNISSAKSKWETLRKLRQLDAAIKIELPSPYLVYKMNWRPYLSQIQRQDLWLYADKTHGYFLGKIRSDLKELIGPKTSRYFTVPHTPYLLDAVICVQNRQVVNYFKACSGAEPFTRVAVIIHMPQHYCKNRPRLLGEYAMKERHLKKLGYKLIEVEYSSYINLSVKQRRNKLKRQLSEYIDFDHHQETLLS